MNWLKLSLVMVVFLVGVANGSDFNTQNLIRVNLVKEAKPDRNNFVYNYEGESEIDSPERNSLTRMNPSRMVGFAYIAEIQVGSPARTFRVSLDSRSGDLWLPSRSCRGIDKTIVTTYNKKKSSTFWQDGRFVSIDYNNGLKVQGELAQESIQFGNLLLKNVTFALVSMNPEGEYLEHHHVDGILGLNLISLAGYRDVQAPLFSIFRELDERTGGSGKPVVSLSLNHGNDPKHAGELIIGGVDESLYVGEITWTPLIDLEGSKFILEKIELRWPEQDESYYETETEEDLILCQDGCEAVLDTELPYITGPEKEIEKLNNVIGGYCVNRGKYTVGGFKDGKGYLPDAILTISGREFVLRPSQYVFRIERMCLSIFSYREGSGDTYWRIGSMFLGQFYTILDYQNKRIGLAESAHKTTKSIFYD